MNIQFWNDRYGKEAFAYGKQPNVFFKNELEKYQPKGSALLPAEGEGRNAVYAAKTGLAVTAFDIADEGRNKALLLAKQEQVEIDYHVGPLESLPVSNRSFDVIGLIYAHFPPSILEKYHHSFATMLAPGGLIILEAFSKSNLQRRLENPAIGGPDKLEMLFDEKMIKRDFKELEILYLKDEEVDLREGQFHNGSAQVIRFVGRKPVT